MNEHSKIQQRFFMQQKSAKRDHSLLNELSENVKRESRTIQQFKSTQNQERAKIERQRLELLNYRNDLQIKEANLKTEKERLKALQKTMESFRHDYVKDLQR
jgi:hypothetical protein